MIRDYTTETLATIVPIVLAQDSTRLCGYADATDSPPPSANVAREEDTTTTAITGPKVDEAPTQPSMTTLVEIRRPLEIRSMNNQPERQTSKRVAAAVDYERDDDFQFVRKTKRAKTDNAEPPKKSGRGRPSVKDRVAETSAQDRDIGLNDGFAPATRRSSRRKASLTAQQEEPELKIPKQGARNATRSTTKRDNNVDTSGPSRGKGGKRGRPPKASRGDSPQQEESVESAKITLPMSDTPIINRNKEMRRKGNSSRRSSLGSRGRRASSLIESGQAAIPHREVNPSDFYKHIEAEGLMEPRRMRQLLMWCAERAMPEKPPHGTPNANAIHGARAIQDQLLKDFSSRSDFSDWFSRDMESKPAGVVKPNPKNIELDEKVEQLLESTRRLQEESKAWQAIQKPPPEQPRLFTTTESEDQITLPDFNLLDPDDGKIHRYLADESESFEKVRKRTEDRLHKVQASLEFEVDQLWDNVHKLEQRVDIASREADKVLSLSAVRLREREDREKASSGTKDMPVMEVLRSLGNILPEGGGG